MNSNKTEQELKAKLDELEAELNQKQTTASKEQAKTVYAEIETESKQEAELMASIYSWLNLARNKFNGLSSGGKLVVGIAAIWLGFTALNMLLHLISNLIIVGILGVVLYFAYRKVVVNS